MSFFGTTMHAGLEGQGWLFGKVGYPQAQPREDASPQRFRATPLKESQKVGRTWQEDHIDRIPSPMRYRARSSDASQYHDASVRVFRGRSVGAEVSAFAHERLSTQAPPAPLDDEGQPVDPASLCYSGPIKGPTYHSDLPSVGSTGSNWTLGAPADARSGYPAATIVPPQTRSLVVFNRSAYKKS